MTHLTIPTEFNMLLQFLQRRRTGLMSNPFHFGEQDIVADALCDHSQALRSIQKAGDSSRVS